MKKGGKPQNQYYVYKEIAKKSVPLPHGFRTDIDRTLRTLGRGHGPAHAIRHADATRPQGGHHRGGAARPGRLLRGRGFGAHVCHARGQVRHLLLLVRYIN